MPVAANASPLILYARVNRLPLLRDLFDEVWIPPKVADECFRRDPSRPGAPALNAILGHWLHEIAPTDRELVQALALDLDGGEAEAIALAMEHDLLLLIDDLTGRDAARARGIAILGCVGILGLAKRHGLPALVKPTLDDLVAHGLRMSRRLYGNVLTAAGETPARNADE